MGLPGFALQLAAFAAFGGLLLVTGYFAAGLTADTSTGSQTVVAGRGFLAESTVGSTAAEAATKALIRHAEVVDLATLSDFKPERLTGAVLARLRAAVASERERPPTALASDGGANAFRLGSRELQEAVAAALSDLEGSFDPVLHRRLVRALGLIAAADVRIQDGTQATIVAAAERLAARWQDSGTSSVGKSKKLLRISVREKPFGMHVAEGTTTVDEVFPNFPAEKAGVQKGCEILKVRGQQVTSGTWLEKFQMSDPPFMLLFSCGAGAGPSSVVGTPVVKNDGKRYIVVVAKKPFGMNVQVNVLPRVVEVLPGYPAEAAGVRVGWVPTHVNEKAVNGQNWFEEFQNAQMPFNLTFITQVALHQGNAYFKPETQDVSAGPSLPSILLATADKQVKEEAVPPSGLVVFRCNVEKVPFGMEVRAQPGTRPRVVSVVPESPADKAGVQVGDILIEVAGIPVTSATWFIAIQQAVPAYGLMFVRPRGRAGDTENTRRAALPGQPASAAPAASEKGAAAQAPPAPPLAASSVR